ncbi:flagellar hook-length control protein FliK [Thalassotalea sp. PLHSN55]|uniref:flagellar hook-length control protein FliK n=1 Tax=Thalassotalea sp. PLHSN55 TaxID=3435888 RepID=UPI003F85DF3E
MPTVSLLSIDLAQGAENKSPLANGADDNNRSEQPFSTLMDKHMSSDTGGNSSEKAAGQSGNTTENPEKSAAKTDQELADNPHSTDKKDHHEISDSGTEQTQKTTEQSSSSANSDAAHKVANESNPSIKSELSESEQLLSMLSGSEKLLTQTPAVDIEKSDAVNFAKTLTTQASSKEQTITSVNANQLASNESETSSDAQIAAQQGAKTKLTAEQEIQKASAKLTDNKLIDHAINGSRNSAINDALAKEQQGESAAALKAASAKTQVATETMVNGQLAKGELSNEQLKNAGLTASDNGESELSGEQLSNKALSEQQKNAILKQAAALQANQDGQLANDDKALGSDDLTAAKQSEQQQSLMSQMANDVKNKEGVFTASAEDRIANQAAKPLNSQNVSGVANDITGKAGESGVDASIKLAQQKISTDGANAVIDTELTPLAKVFRDTLAAADGNKNIDNQPQSAQASAKVAINGANVSEEFTKQEHAQQQAQQGKQQEQNLAGLTAEKSAESAFKVAQAMTSSAQSIFSTASESSTERVSSTTAEQLLGALSSRVVTDNAQVQKVQTNAMQETIAIHHKDFSHAVKEKVMLMVNQKLQQVDIRLDPPELGSMQIRVNLQNEQAAVSFTVQNQQAKEALEQNLTKLREMLAESGVDVGDANINHQQQSDQQEDEFAQHNGQAQSHQAEQEDVQIATLDGNLFKASANGIDYYA